MAEIAVTGTGGHNNLDTMKRMRAIVLKIMGQLLLAELDALGFGDRLAWHTVEHEPVPCLAGVP